MFEKVVPVGGNMGVPFDDGVFDGVKKIIIGKDSECLAFIKIEYEKDEKYQTVVHGTIRGGLVSQEFWIEYPNEYITSVGGTYDHVPSQGTVVIKSLIFATSYRRTCPVLGVPGGKQFWLEGPTGGKLLGFHGRSSRAINSIGAYFFGVSPPLKHFSRQGGNGGSVWDDGAYDGVRRINVSLGGRFVAYCRFEYARGKRMVPHAHGKLQNHPQPFVVDYPNEEIISVEGTIDVYLTSLRFKTSNGRTSPTFGSVVGRRFVFEENGFKLVGFCGRSADFIDALGAHFAPFSPLTPATTPPSASAPIHAPTSTPTPSPIPAPAPGSTGGMGLNVGGSGVDTSFGGVHKLEARGGQGGKQWDDGADFEGVINIYVAPGGRGIENIRFDYVKNGDTKKGPLRSVQSRGVISTIAINHPDEYLESVEGWYDSSNIIQGIKFQTNKKTSDDIGYVFDGDGRQFSLKVKDKKIIGFHGFADSNLNSLGAYFVPISSSSAPSPNKLEAQGGNGGDIFDDGSFDDIRKVYVGQGESSVAYIRFEYEKNGKIETREHGKRTLLGTEEFEVGQDDYITSVEVYYEKIFGMPSEIITSLIFNTFKGKTSQPFGLVSGNKTMLQGGKGKIVGFHGRASHVLHALGIYISPLV